MIGSFCGVLRHLLLTSRLPISRQVESFTTRKSITNLQSVGEFFSKVIFESNMIGSFYGVLRHLLLASQLPISRLSHLLLTSQLLISSLHVSLFSKVNFGSNMIGSFCGVLRHLLLASRLPIYRLSHLLLTSRLPISSLQVSFLVK